MSLVMMMTGARAGREGVHWGLGDLVLGLARPPLNILGRSLLLPTPGSLRAHRPADSKVPKLL